MREVNATATANTNDYIVWSSGGTFTFYLPAASTNLGRHIYVKKMDGAGTMTVESLGGTIDGGTSVTYANNTYVSSLYVSNGANWMRLSHSA